MHKSEMADKLPALSRKLPSAHSRASLPKFQDFPNLELLKSITFADLTDLSTCDGLSSTPIALIPETLGHSQRFPKHNKELATLEKIHLNSPEPVYSSPSRATKASQYISLSRADGSKRSLFTPTKHSVQNYQRRMPSLSAKKTPSTTRCSSVIAKRGTFLSYLLDKSLSFTASGKKKPIHRSIGLPSYRTKSVRSSAKTSKLSQEDATEVLSYIGDYHGGEREGDGEAVYRSGDTYKGSWGRNKRSGYGEYVYQRLSLTYKGDWYQDLKHGRGVVIFTNGDSIESLWSEDKCQEGKGTIQYVESEGQYTGDLKDGNKDGDGFMKYPCGAEFRGSWLIDKRHGSGLLKFGDGSMFEGSFEHDYASGCGLLHLKNVLALKNDMGSAKTTSRSQGIVWSREEKEAKFGDLDDFYGFKSAAALSPSDVVWKTLTLTELEARLGPVPGADPGSFKAGSLTGSGLAMYGEFGFYVGGFLEGKRSGFGRMTYTNEGPECLHISDSVGEYEGQWRRDMRHGTGRMKWKNGLIYEGQFRNDHRHNVQGILIFPTGERYSGAWVSDLMHGLGHYEDGNGLVFHGKFISGCPCREGTIDIPEGGHYEGELKEMKPYGHGRMQYSTGDVYIGDFLDGIRQGAGEMTYANGSVYAGEWKDGMREGWGAFRSPTESYEGGWSRDRKNGHGLLRGQNGSVVFEGSWRDDAKEGHGTHCDV